MADKEINIPDNELNDLYSQVQVNRPTWGRRFTDAVVNDLNVKSRGLLFRSHQYWAEAIFPIATRSAEVMGLTAFEGSIFVYGFTERMVNVTFDAFVPDHHKQMIEFYASFVVHLLHQASISSEDEQYIKDAINTYGESIYHWVARVRSGGNFLAHPFLLPRFQPDSIRKAMVEHAESIEEVRISDLRLHPIEHPDVRQLIGLSPKIKLPKSVARDTLRNLED